MGRILPGLSKVEVLDLFQYIDSSKDGRIQLK
jgi:hypothetical protein